MRGEEREEPSSSAFFSCLMIALWDLRPFERGGGERGERESSKGWREGRVRRKRD